MGNIQDEYDHEEEEIHRMSETEFTVDGAASIDEVADMAGVDLPEGDYDTIAGLVTERLGRLPKAGEHPQVKEAGLTITVLEVEEQRIARLLLVKGRPGRTNGKRGIGTEMSQSQTTSQENALATAPIGKLLFSLAVPAITAQVVNMLYNIVDRIYIGHIPEIGTAALTGVGITFPIITLISAFSSLIAMGGAPRASIAMGAHHKERAEEIMGNCFTALLALSVALTAVFQIFQEPILWALWGQREHHWLRHGLHGASTCGGTVFVQISLGMNMFITSQGLCQNQHAYGDYRRGAETFSWTRSSSLSLTWACGARPLPRCSARRFRRCGCCCSSVAGAPL